MTGGVLFPSSERESLIASEEYRREPARLVHALRFAGRTISSQIDVGAPEPVADLKGAWWTALRSGAVPRPAAQRARPFRAVDLFCGPGGLALGARNLCAEIGLPVRTELIVDEDEEATDVYASNHDTRIRRVASVASLVDFRLRRRGTDAAFVYEPEIVEPRLAAAARGVDLVIAGPPCQGHSNLNNQTRRDDVRNALYLTVPAFAVATRARMAIVENVPEVTSDRSRVVQTARRLFESAGYSVEEGILAADPPPALSRRSHRRRTDSHPRSLTRAGRTTAAACVVGDRRSRDPIGRRPDGSCCRAQPRESPAHRLVVRQRGVRPSVFGAPGVPSREHQLSVGIQPNASRRTGPDDHHRFHDAGPGPVRPPDTAAYPDAAGGGAPAGIPRHLPLRH